MSYIKLIIGIIVAWLRGKKEPSERVKAKKRLKELNSDIKKYAKAAKKARSLNHVDQFNHYTDELRELKSKRKEIQDILCE